MRQTLDDFFKALRGSGFEISVSESLDAMQAVQLVGLSNRQTFKNALAISLAKSLFDKERFNECFEQFFSLSSFQNKNSATDSSEAVKENVKSELAKMLLEDDKEKLAWTMQKAAKTVGVTDIWFFTQKGLYIRKILEQMGIRELNEDISRLSGGGGGPGGGSGSGGQAGALRQARDYLREEVRNYVEKQLSLYSHGKYTQLVEDYLKDVRLSNIEAHDFKYMHEIVRKMAKRLSTIHLRKRKQENRGVLDFRKTLRKNLAYDGLMFETHWKKKTADRPRIVAVCDVSRSVRQYSRFLLLFLYSLNDVIANIRSFAFVDRLVEISDIFDAYPVEQAIEKIQIEVGGGSTNYGQVFLDIKNNNLDDIDHRTTVIILGDARNNYLDPQTRILKQLYQHCKRLMWLNPEYKTAWGTGDSEMFLYAPYCNFLKQCSTIRHLERMVGDLLRAASQNA